MSFVVAIENITKRFHGKNVLDDFSLEIQGGTINGLVGLHSSGKTTALLCLLGLQHIDDGNINWRMDRKSVGAFVGLPAFHRELSIRGNLEAQASLLPKSRDSSGYAKRIDYLMEQLQITPVYAGERKARNLLLGQKQRLSIAMAMLGEPELLILDEPHLGLDEYELRVCNAILHNEGYGKTKTALITAAHAEDISEIATKIVYLREGRNASF